MRPSVILAMAVAIALAAGAVWLWRPPQLRPEPSAQAQRSQPAIMGALYPGTTPPARPTSGPTSQETSSYDLAEGKRLYHWFNCQGCHANGGGDIGPALMDDKWIYGSDPRNVFETILAGRPNGMPSFQGKITDAQAWQIVGYVRSLGGLVPQAKAPGRNDDLKAKPPENRTDPQAPVGTPIPKASEGSQ